MTHFDLIRDNEESISVPELAAALAPVLKRPRVDIAVALRYGAGWIARNLDEQHADRAVVECRKLGVETALVPSDRFSEAVPVFRVLQARLSDELELTLPLGQESLSQEDVAAFDLVAYGVMPEKEEEQSAIFRDARTILGQRKEDYVPQLCALIDHKKQLQPRLYLHSKSTVFSFEEFTQLPDYAEAKGNGFDQKALRKIVSLRKVDEDKRREEDLILATYMKALGMEG